MHETILEYYMLHSLPNLAGVVALNRSFQIYDCIEGFPRVFAFLVHRNRRLATLCKGLPYVVG